MTRITENTIEDFAIKLMERLGYEYTGLPLRYMPCYSILYLTPT